MKFIAFFLALTLSVCSLFSCTGEDTEQLTPPEAPPAQEAPPSPPDPEGVLDWCVYKTERDVTDRDTYKIKITVRDYGEITLLLDATTAPITVENFTRLASSGFYNGLRFHRVVENFMIQGGAPESVLPKTIKGEFASNGHENDIKHLRGVISMARGSSKDSASCQFFICNADAPHLDGDYAAFGYVIEGMNVVDKITNATKNLTDVYKDNIITYKVHRPIIEKVELI